MKRTKTCPKCDSRALWYVAQVAANGETGTEQEHPRFDLAVTGNGNWGKDGPMEAYACRRCGYTELYLKKELRADGKHVVELGERTTAPPGDLAPAQAQCTCPGCGRLNHAFLTWCASCGGLL